MRLNSTNKRRHRQSQFYISETLSRNFIHVALLIAECLAGYYQAGELTVVDLKQIIDAVEGANEVYMAFYDTQTDKTAYLPDEITIGKRDEDLGDLIEGSPTGRFLYFPTKYKIHKYSKLYRIPAACAAC